VVCKLYAMRSFLTVPQIIPELGTHKNAAWGVAGRIPNRYP